MRTIEIALPTELPSEELAPKTPLPEFFSPTPSEPSAARDEGRDTPPPSGLKSMSSGPAALNGASRPSRRARAAVNYAEPNLVSKMRRPTATLANAVDANGRRISQSSASATKSMRTVVIKGDDMARSLTRELDVEAASPLGDKAHREHERLIDTSQSTSASSRAISALMAGSKSYENHGASEDVGVYELKGSSDAEESRAADKRRSRRHSSVTDVAEKELAKTRPSDGGEEQSSMDGEDEKHEVEVQDRSRKAPRTARVDRSGARRRSMMV